MHAWKSRFSSSCKCTHSILGRRTHCRVSWLQNLIIIHQLSWLGIEEVMYFACIKFTSWFFIPVFFAVWQHSWPHSDITHFSHLVLTCTFLGLPFWQQKMNGFNVFHKLCFMGDNCMYLYCYFILYCMAAIHLFYLLFRVLSMPIWWWLSLW